MKNLSFSLQLILYSIIGTMLTSCIGKCPNNTQDTFLGYIDNANNISLYIVRNNRQINFTGDNYVESVIIYSTGNIPTGESYQIYARGYINSAPPTSNHTMPPIDITGLIESNLGYWTNNNYCNLTSTKNSCYLYVNTSQLGDGQYGINFYSHHNQVNESNLLTYPLTQVVTNRPDDYLAFKSTWRVSAGESITLPIYNGGSYNFTVNWGDGSAESGPCTSYNCIESTHIYTNAGDYIVTINGKLNGFNFGQISISKNNFVNVLHWGNIQLGNAIFISSPNLVNGIFENTIIFESAPAQDIPNLTSITYANRMFDGASQFNQLLNNWNTSNITDMMGMFGGATTFNQPLNDWNVSHINGTYGMYGLFAGASMFNQPLNNWDVSNVENMSWMFSGSSFNQDISNWRVANVTLCTNFAINSPISGTANRPKTSNIESGSRGTSFPNCYFISTNSGGDANMFQKN